MAKPGADQQRAELPSGEPPAPLGEAGLEMRPEAEKAGDCGKVIQIAGVDFPISS